MLYEISLPSVSEVEKLRKSGRPLQRDELPVSSLVGNVIVALDTQAMRAGDVVLFEKEEGFKHEVIRQSQLKMMWVYEADIARRHGGNVRRAVIDSEKEYASEWTHVGMLDESFCVWEARGATNVIQTPLREILKSGRRVRLSRFRGANFSYIGLRNTLIRFSNTEYELGNFIAQLRRRMKRNSLVVGEKRLDKNIAEKVICSVFVSDVMDMAFSGNVMENVETPVPADFLLHSSFVPVHVEWRIVKEF